jgi:hypothetical protein
MVIVSRPRFVQFTGSRDACLGKVPGRPGPQLGDRELNLLARLAADVSRQTLGCLRLLLRHSWIARTSNDMKYKAIALYVAVSRELGGIRPLDHLGDRNHQSRNRSVVGACVF